MTAPPAFVACHIPQDYMSPHYVAHILHSYHKSDCYRGLKAGTINGCMRLETDSLDDPFGDGFRRLVLLDEDRAVGPQFFGYL